ncbi:unnamed protein product [Rangifer tarandus platyrhynchus]|uniref:Uncharacterized protein n=2 Tax=Rangifer tarandus platyrhynchus TaxID=3082113 RepID=A0ACB0F7K3_RANTA|nr:unnamed protein product [Rangifer tarandus platyrhynchus]CAI9708483.1 unnamed protein product [Rangifer tarandus platyrhynchus]
MRRAGVEPALPAAAAAELGRRRRFAATWRPSSGRGAAVTSPPAELGDGGRGPPDGEAPSMAGMDGRSRTGSERT